MSHDRRHQVVKWLRTHLPMLRGFEDRRYIFILTYGRSGSTLLMNLINSGEGCCIRGENNGALHSIYESYKGVVEAQQQHGKNSLRESSPWRGLKSVDPDRYARKLVRAFVEEVLRPGPGDQVCGFKEIRYSSKDVPDLVGYVEFMRKFFPYTKFVINHRNLDDVARSKWWSSMPQAVNLLHAFEERLNEIDASSTVLHFSYDTALADRSHVQRLFEFLDLPYDDDAVSEVFSRKHSY